MYVGSDEIGGLKYMPVLLAQKLKAPSFHTMRKLFANMSARAAFTTVAFTMVVGAAFDSGCQSGTS